MMELRATTYTREEDVLLSLRRQERSRVKILYLVVRREEGRREREKKLSGYLNVLNQVTHRAHQDCINILGSIPRAIVPLAQVGHLAHVAALGNRGPNLISF